MATVTKMKKFFLAIALLMAVPCFAQKVGGDPKNNIVHVGKSTKASKGKLVNSGHSVQDPDDKKVYVVWITAKNRLIIKKVSKKTGNEYSDYLKGKKKYEEQYVLIVADLKKQGITVE